MDVFLEHLLRDCHPLLLQEPEELGTINRLGVIVHDPAPNIVPQMFYGRQIGRSGRPIQSHNLLMLHLIPDHPDTFAAITVRQSEARFVFVKSTMPH
nr:hypothetical protein BaRGS_024914 [Batillaria attramentaria]